MSKLPHLSTPPVLEEFKKFVLKGNVVSLSTGVIIGSAFNNIVTAFTKGVVGDLVLDTLTGSAT
ncbi:MAG: MscL family protein, partial [Verrucomicrobiota bacterium]